MESAYSLVTRQPSGVYSGSNLIRT